MINALDLQYLQCALDEAHNSEHSGGRPIGAALTIDGRLVDQAANTAKSTGTAWRHAENVLLIDHSELVVTARKLGGIITLYTTVECCLMCLGSAIHHRVSRIVYACPDPLGGTLRLESACLDLFSRDHWPIVEGGIDLAALPDPRGGQILVESITLFRRWVNRWHDDAGKVLTVRALDRLRAQIDQVPGP